MESDNKMTRDTAQSSQFQASFIVNPNNSQLENQKYQQEDVARHILTPTVPKRNSRSSESNDDDFGKILEKKVEGGAEKIDPNNKEQITNIILDALLEVNDKTPPQLNNITEIVTSTFKKIITTFTDSDESKLIDLCSNFIGEDKKYYKETLLYNAAMKRKQPELVQKLFNCGFDDNNKHSKLINFVFCQAAQKFINNEENIEVIKIILNYKKSIEKEDISDAIKSNNIELLNVYLHYYPKCIKKSIEKTDISDAIKSNNMELLKFFFKFDKGLETKITSRNNQKSHFDLAVESSDIHIIKYLLDNLRQNPIDKMILNIANERKKNSPDQGAKISNFLEKKLKIIENQTCYLKELFELDASTITKIYNVLQEIQLLYKENQFLSWEFIIENDQPNSLLEFVQNGIDESYKEKFTYKVVTKLKEIAELIELLCTHDGGIQNKFNKVPWSELKLLPEVLVNTHKINEISTLDARKLLEQISYDIYKLCVAFRDIIDSLQDKNTPSFEKFCGRNENSSIQVRINNINNLTKKFNDCRIISSTLHDIKILKSLDFSEVNDRYAFVQCLQSIGEKCKHFSVGTQNFLKKFDVFQKMRNEIAHIWDRDQYTVKFLTILETDEQQQDAIKQYFKDWKSFIVGEYEQVLKKVQGQYDQLNFSTSEALDSKVSEQIQPHKLKGLVQNITITCEIYNAVLLTDSLVNSKMNLIKYLVNNVQKVVEDIHDNDYQKIRSELRKPQIHYKFIFILTIIGESIHKIKNEDDYLSISNFELLKELDFLKCVRNALMHLHDINANGTLIDYFANDLLVEFSIATHGQKIIEFSEYFKYLSELIHNFQQNLKRLGDDNFLQDYQDQHKRYLDLDVEQKKHRAVKTINSLDANKEKLQCFDTNKFNINTLIQNQIEIENKCKELNINVEGVFGKLANRGYTEPEDLSGLLVTINGNLSLGDLAKFKQFVFEKLKYRLKVIEVRQLVEYLEYTVNDKQSVTYKTKLIEKTRKYSLDNLRSNIGFIHALNSEHQHLDILAEDFDTSSVIEQFAAKLKIKEEAKRKALDYYSIDLNKISFDLSYQGSHYSMFSESIIHQLYDIYEEESNKKSKDIILRLVKEILDKGADINIVNDFKYTILHKLCNKYDQAFFTLIKKYSNNLNVNLENSEDQLPIQIALQEDNLELIKFLKDKTNYKESLLISAVKVGNIEYVHHLITNIEKININIQGENGTPIIHYAIFYEDQYLFKEIICERINPDNFKQIIHLLLKNGAEVSCFEEKHPLMWSLENNDVELSLLLVENTVDLHHDHFSIGGIHPIHKAILNLAQHYSQKVLHTHQFLAQSDDYIKLIKKIAEKSNYMINCELRNHSETPLYLIAKQKDIGVDLRLEVMKILIDNGADINYKVYRFSDIVKIIDNEIIKFFLDNGMRGAHKYLDHYKDLFSFYESGAIQKLKTLVAEQSINLNVLDDDGKNLFYYAIEKQDTEFVYWLSSQAGVVLNLDIEFKNKDNWYSYYIHLADYANGSILEVLQAKGIINWVKFNYIDIKNICDNALKNDDLEVIKLLEEHNYFNIDTRSLKTIEIKKYLKLYLEVFECISRGKNEKLETKIKKLKNKSVLFNDYSLLHIAVCANNLPIVEFLLGQADVLDKNILWGKKLYIGQVQLDSPLDSAVTFQSKLEIMNILIEKDVKITQNFPIHKYLVLSGQDEENERYNLILKYLKRHSDYKEIIFQYAYQREFLQDPSFIKLLLALDWNPNQSEKVTGFFNGGLTALHICAYEGYNESIKALCKSEKLDFELPIENFIISYTSGILTAVGFALEGGKFVTAKLLIERGASPYKYLSILLLDALYKKDINYIKLLLQKSVIYDSEETSIYLNRWLKSSFTGSKILQAITFLIKSKEINIPGYICTHLVNISMNQVSDDKVDFLNDKDAAYNALYIAIIYNRCNIFKQLANKIGPGSLTLDQIKEILNVAPQEMHQDIIDLFNAHSGHDAPEPFKAIN